MKEKIRIQNLLQNYSKGRIYWHIIFWTLYLLFASIAYYRTSPLQFSFGEVVIHYAISIPVDIVATYVTVYFLIPRYLSKKKYVHFIILIIISSLIFVIWQQFIYISFPDFFFESLFFRDGFQLKYFFTATKIYPVTALFIAIKYIKKSFVTQKLNQELEKKRLEAELKFLKSQIHPHFLFNTLNNLYALTLDKSDQAPEVVIKLSSLLDYMLYETNVTKIPIIKEINLIKNYIELEQIRYKNAEINLNVEGETGSKHIAPLLLLPFIENSFKHGLSQNTSNLWVQVSLICHKDRLIFSVKNSKNPILTNKLKSYTEGIGLKNVERRLDLIYPNNYELLIEDSINTFNVDLKINID